MLIDFVSFMQRHGSVSRLFCQIEEVSSVIFNPILVTIIIYYDNAAFWIRMPVLHHPSARSNYFCIINHSDSHRKAATFWSHFMKINLSNLLFVVKLITTFVGFFFSYSPVHFLPPSKHLSSNYATQFASFPNARSFCCIIAFHQFYISTLFSIFESRFQRIKLMVFIT